MSQLKGYVIAFAAIASTLKTSVATLWDSGRGPTTQKRTDDRIDRWSKSLLRLAKIEIEVEGSEHLYPVQARVVMSNHQSLYDIPILFQVVPPSMRMIAKRELFLIPIFGAAMAAAGFISIDRKNRQKAFQSLRAAQLKLKEGTQVWIAPEGTRSPDGKLGAFRKGGFVMAEEMGLPILPVTINGAREVLPSGSFSVRSGLKVRVKIHPPVAPGSDRAAVAEKVRDAIGSGLTTSRLT